VVVEKNVEKLRVDRPDYDKKNLSVEIPEHVNSLNANKLIEKSNLPYASNRNEVLLHAGIPAKNSGLIRNIFINKYIQTQENSVFLKDNPILEIKI